MQSTDVLSRVIWGSRTAIEVVVLAVVFSLADRRAARPALRLRRRQARPRPGADHRRALRLPVPAAGDRDRVPALRLGRPGRVHRRDRDHGRLHPAVLPRRPQPRDQRPRGVLRRGGAGARRPAADDHRPLRLLQRDPERARDRDPERRRRDPHPRRARLPRLRDPADRRRRVGLRPAARDRRRRRRDLVDRAVPRARDRAAGDRLHARRRGHQRHPQPADPPAPDRAARDPRRPDAGDRRAGHVDPGARAAETERSTEVHRE